MKIAKSQLKQMIKEAVQSVIEQSIPNKNSHKVKLSELKRMIAEEVKKYSPMNEELHNVISKHGDSWRIRGHHGLWPQHYKSKEDAEAALKAYHSVNEEVDAQILALRQKYMELGCNCLPASLDSEHHYYLYDGEEGCMMETGPYTLEDAEDREFVPEFIVGDYFDVEMTIELFKGATRVNQEIADQQNDLHNQQELQNKAGEYQF